MDERVHVIESQLTGKVSPESCEDALVVTGDFIAVIDGVTAKTTFTHHDQTTGEIAALIVRDTICNADPHARFEDILDAVDASFASFYREVDFPGDRLKQGPQAMAAIYSAQRRIIWMVGDCLVSVDGTTYLNVKPSDEILAQFRSLIIAIMVEERRHSGQSVTLDELLGSHDPARDVILPWILRSTVFANNADTPFGYSVFNGQPIPSQLVKTITLDDLPAPQHGEHEIVLASDGYPLAYRTQPAPGVPHESVTKPYVPTTLTEAERILATTLNDDPYCCRTNISTKGMQPGQHSFDDRTYIRFRVPADH